MHWIKHIIRITITIHVVTFPFKLPYLEELMPYKTNMAIIILITHSIIYICYTYLFPLVSSHSIRSIGNIIMAVLICVLL